MRLAVVIPNLHSPVLHQTLAALAGQTWPIAQAEVVVVGLDRYRYGERFPFARRLDTGRPVTPGEARNLGVAATHGDVVVFLDADSIPCPDWLARLARWFEDPAVAVVGGSVAFPWDDPYWTVCDNVSNVHAFAPSAPAGERLHLTSCNLAVRRAALERVGLFDPCRYPQAAEDTDLTLRLKLAGYTLHFDPQAMVEHRQGALTWRAMLRKAYTRGYYSCRVDRRYASQFGVPPMLLNSTILRLASAGLAAVTTLRIYRHDRGLRRRWVWPGVFLAKLAWCWGAAHRLAEPREPGSLTSLHGLQS